MQANYLRLREEAYARGQLEYDQLAKLPTTPSRDFVALYVAEGYKRPLSQQDVDEPPYVLGRTAATIDPATVRLHPKTNSGGLRRRVWRCAHGVASGDVYDTLFRARLQAWIDRVQCPMGIYTRAN